MMPVKYCIACALAVVFFGFLYYLQKLWDSLDELEDMVWREIFNED